MFSVRRLVKRYTSDFGAVTAVAGVSFSAADGEFYTLLGPSGCGKTTTLQCLAGLETPDEGEIELAGTLVFSSARRVNRPAHAREIGLVFQSYAIWPHMTVYDNVAYPLVHGRHKAQRSEVRKRVMNALDMVHLADLAQRPAPFLSGGQQQRVAVARALVDEPQVLLLDEPLSNLDAKLREGMRQELRSLIKRLGITTLYVTHDQVEALSMSDRLAVMANGHILQEGAPRDIYLRPSHRLVADFVGRINFLPATVSGEGLVDSALGELRVASSGEFAAGARVLAAIRPEAFQLSTSGCNGNVIEGTVEMTSFYGEFVEYQVAAGDRLLTVRGEPYADVQLGQQVQLTVPAERIMLLPAEEAGDQSKSEALVEGLTVDP